MNLFWFLPTSGDGRYLATSLGARVVDLNYLRQIANAADSLGFDGVLLPTGRGCEDTWVSAAAMIGYTQRLKFLVAARPGLMSPTVSARMAATFDRLSDGRLLVNVVSSGDPAENHGDGLFLDHDARYDVTDEFLTIWRRVLSGEEVTFQGKHLAVKNARLMLPGLQVPHPPLYFGGSSPKAMEIAIKHVDKYLTWGEPVEMAEEKIQRVKKLAADAGKTLTFGMRLHVIVREDESDAWAEANRLVRYVDDQAVADARKVWAQMDSVGQQRMTKLTDAGRDNLVIGKNLWAGIGLVRGGAGTALVGNPEQVAQRMREYAAIGIDTFIMSGYPHLEEAYRVADLLFPLLKTKSDSIESNHHGTVKRKLAAYGEVIADTHPPKR